MVQNIHMGLEYGAVPTRKRHPLGAAAPSLSVSMMDLIHWEEYIQGGQLIDWADPESMRSAARIIVAGRHSPDTRRYTEMDAFQCKDPRPFNRQDQDMGAVVRHRLPIARLVQSHYLKEKCPFRHIYLYRIYNPHVLFDIS